MRDKDVNEMDWFIFITGPLLPGYLSAINVDVRKKKRESVDIGNSNYRQQIGGKLGLDKTCQYKKKFDRGDFDISGVHCSSVVFTHYGQYILLPADIHKT